MAVRESRGRGPRRESRQDDSSYQPRTVAGLPSWALVMIGAGTLAVGAGFVGYWSADRSDATQPMAFQAPVSASASVSPSASVLTPGPDGMFATPTPLATGTPVPVTSGAISSPGTAATPAAPVAPVATVAPRTTPRPTVPGTSAAAVPVNPATAAPRTTAAAPKPTTPAPAPATSSAKSSKTTAPPLPAPATSSTKTAAAPAATTTAPDPDEVPVAGPPSGLIVTAEDLNFGKCPAKFSTKVEVEVEYGTVASAKAKWVASATGAKGSADLPKSATRSFTGTISGIPTKTPVLLTVEVSGPDGTASSEPFEVTHSC